MSEYEQPDRAGREVTVEDVRQLMGASTPHFSLQIRNRLRNLVADLPAENDARILAEREIERLEALAFEGEERGPAQPGERELPSIRDARGHGVADEDDADRSADPAADGAASAHDSGYPADAHH